jgi:colanic acid/amylovoran biosynthesis protein
VDDDKGEVHRTMRIAITNTVALNGGDAAIAMSLAEAVERAAPSATVEIHDSQPEVVRRYFPERDWRPQIGSLVKSRSPIGQLVGPEVRLSAARLLAAVRMGQIAGRPPIGLTETERARIADFAALDLVISTGGTYLIEQYPLEARMFEYRLAGILGIPVIFFTQSLGPFRRRRNQRLLGAAFRRSPLLLARDVRSADHLRALGVTGNHVRVVADGVFSLAGHHVAFTDLRDAKRPVRMAVSVRVWPPGRNIDDPAVRRFAAAMTQALQTLATKLPAEILLVSTCQGVPEYWADDSRLANQIASGLTGEARARTRVDDSFHRPEELRAMMADADVVLATRMHMAILALTAGTPVVAIAYEFKTRELFRRMGLEHYVLDIESVDADALTNSVLSLMTNFTEVCRQSEQAVRAEASRAEEGAQLLSDAIAELNGTGAGGGPLRRRLRIFRSEP